MPIYDCGVPDCTECQRAFGPDRSVAIKRHQAREAQYTENAAKFAALAKTNREAA